MKDPKRRFAFWLPVMRQVLQNNGYRCLSVPGILLLASIALVTPSRANIWSWSGGGGANAYWNNSANWGFAGVPANGDTVVFPASQPNLVNTNNITGLVLNQIRFAGAGGGYDIRGNAFTLTNGISATNSIGTNIIENGITLSTAPNALIIVSNGVNLTLDGALASSGTVGVTKTGLGTLTYQGAGNNTYSGTTLVSAGTLQFNVGGISAFGGALVIGDGTGTGSPTVQDLQSTEMANSAPITINQSGTLDLNNFSEIIGPNLTLTAGNIQTENGTLTLSPSSTVTVGTGASSITGNLNVGSGTCTFAVGGSLSVGALVSGSATIDKSGAGTLTFSGNNTYSGLTVVQQGILVAENSLALGATSSGTIVSNTATLELAGGISIINEPLTLNGPGISGVWGALDVESGVNTWAGPITNNANSTLDSWSSGSELHISGPIGGPGSLELFNSGSGGGTEFFEGTSPNTYLGTTTVDPGALLELNKPSVFYGSVPGNLTISGTVRLLTGYQIYYAAAVTINSGGLLDLNGYAAYVGALNGSSGSSLALGSGYLYADYGFGGASTFGGVISGAGGTLDKQGPGTLILNNNNTYTGTSRVSFGTLLINGSQPQSPTYVDINATLGGSGIVGAVTLNGSTINTGSSQLQINGDVITLGATNATMIEGAIRFANGLRTVTVNQGSAPGGWDVLIPGSIADTGSGFQMVNGTGTTYVRIQGSNSFTGPLTISGLGVNAETPWALGSTNGGTFVNNGGELALVFTSITNETVTLAAGTTFAGQSGGPNAVWKGPVTLSGDATIYGFNFVGLFDIQGPITGTGNLLVISDGEPVQFSGSLANTYSGTTTVGLDYFGDGATLLLDKGGFGYAIPNSLVISNNCTVQLENSWQLDSSGKSVTLFTNGLLNLAGYNDWIGPVSIQGAQITSGAGVLYLSGDITVQSSLTAHSVISGNANIYSDVITITNTSHNFSPDMTISAIISSSGTTNGLIKTGGGEVTLTGSNLFTGPVTINGGSLWAQTSTALGATNLPVTVNNGGTLFLDGTNMDFGLKPLTLSGAGWGGDGALISAGSSSWEGDVTLPSFSNALIYNYTNSSLTLAGMISGTGGFIKDGPGTNTLAGGTSNPYGGTTYVNRGILNLMKTGGQFGIGDGALTIGTGLGNPASAVVRSFGYNEIFAVPLTVNSDGLLDLNGNNDLLVSSVTLNNANIQNTSAGTLSLYSGTILTVNPGSSTISGNLNVTTNSYWTNSGSLTMTAAVSGNANIYKSGSGAAYLMTSNSFTGLMVVQQGWLYAENNYALGATTAGTIVSNGASLVLQGNVAITNESLTLNGPGVSTVWGALDVESGTNIWASSITVNSNCTLDAWNASSALHINGQISGPGSLELFGYSGGGGTHYFEGVSTNSFVGTTTVDTGSTLQLNDSTTYGAVPTNVVVSGTLRLANSEQIGAGADVLVNAGGLFDFGSFAQDVNTLHGTGNITFGVNGFLDIGGFGGTSEFDGLMSGTGYTGGYTVGKYGTGTFTMTGNNTYLNRSDIYGGTLVINGLQPQNPVLVGPGCMLRGSGSVGPISAQGTVYPGNSPGILTSSNVTFSSSGIYRVEIAGPNPGTGYDQLNVTGTVSLASAALQLHMTTVGAINSLLTIINNDGTDPVTGTFSGLTEGATVVADNGVQFKITYKGGTSNDVVLMQISLPTRPVFTGISNLGGGNIQLNGTGFTNLAYTVQGTTNLTTANWVYVGTATANGGGQIQFTDPSAASFPTRFYRFTWP